MEKNKIPGFFGEKGRDIITVKKYICHINALTSSVGQRPLPTTIPHTLF
jgi:hypothetical protein